jgi:DNA-binding transcriptional LysR family regulator
MLPGPGAAVATGPDGRDAMDPATQFDWDDVRFFLAVARTGSTIGAARMLAVSQSTVARRIAAFEAALETTLFERTIHGYRLTAQGRNAVSAAEAVEAGMVDLAPHFAPAPEVDCAPLRVTSSEIFARLILLPALEDLKKSRPDLRAELEITDGGLDLAGGEADLGFRGGPPPTVADLVVRRMPMPDRWAVYGHSDYVAEHGLPRSEADLSRHSLLTVVSPAAPDTVDWMLARGARQLPAIVGFSGLMAEVRSGAGLALLPCAVGEVDPSLVCALAPEQAFPVEFRAIYHARLRGRADIRDVIAAVLVRCEAARRIGPDPISVS